MSNLIELQHVSRFYGTVIGAGDLNLELKRGAYGLVGPNGSGKTTFINLVTGMLSPSIGQVRVLGKDPEADRTVLSQIGLCPASEILMRNVSALQWVEYQTALHGFSKSEAHSRAVDTLVQVGMEEGMRRPIGTYSLGMRQRTKLAQAMAHDPELLILDEPFNGLDPIGRHELTDCLNDWIERGKSLILASHILHEVEAVTSSFLLIHGGRILASGHATEVRSMLSGFPVEVKIWGKGLEAVVTSLSEESWLRGIDIEDDMQSLTIRVADRGAFQKRLQEIAMQPNVCLSRVESPDGSLEAAFDLLLQVHRGEHVF